MTKTMMGKMVRGPELWGVVSSGVLWARAPDQSEVANDSPFGGRTSGGEQLSLVLMVREMEAPLRMTALVVVRELDWAVTVGLDWALTEELDWTLARR